MIFNVNCIIDYIKEHDPIQIENLSLDENPWVNQESRNMRYNKDLYKELFIFSSEEEERSKDNVTKSIYDMFVNNTGMNKLGKRYLTKYLSSPLSNIQEINKRYEDLELISVPKEFYNDIIDVDQYYLKWRRNLLSERLFAKLILQYKDLTKKYSKIKVLVEFIECHFNLEIMMKNE